MLDRGLVVLIGKTAVSKTAFPGSSPGEPASFNELVTQNHV